MKKTRGLFLFLACGALATLLSSCGGSGANNESILGGADDPAYLRMELTDAPLTNAKSVFVNILSVEIFVQKAGKTQRVTFTTDVGLVDLLKLQNGVLRSLGELQLPPGAAITQIRIILGSGNSVLMNDGSVCDLPTPSTQTSAINIALNGNVTTQPDQLYDLALDFQSDLSVTSQGPGMCQLNPHVNLNWITQAPIIPPPANKPGSHFPPPPPPGGVITNGPPAQLPVSGKSDGSWGDDDATTDPPLIDPGQLWGS